MKGLGWFWFGFLIVRREPVLLENLKQLGENITYRSENDLIILQRRPESKFVLVVVMINVLDLL